jgi:hypothetical protein
MSSGFASSGMKACALTPGSGFVVALDMVFFFWSFCVVGLVG